MPAQSANRARIVTAGEDEEPEQVRLPMLQQRWDVISFLHWPYEPEVVRPLVPEPFELDLFGGSAWIGLVPFRMTVRPPGLPAIPGLSTFPETNVRTYVRGPDGNRGLWFFSLDVGSLANAAAGALMGLSYRWSSMKIDGGPGERSYHCRRLIPPGSVTSPIASSVTSSVKVLGTAEPVEQTDLDRFLTARFRLYATGPLGPFEVRVEHSPWQLFHAHAPDVSDGLVTAAGLPFPTDAPLVHRGADVSVRVGVPSLLGAPTGVSRSPTPTEPTRRSAQGPRPPRPAAPSRGASSPG
jgi:uncharacterized protein